VKVAQSLALSARLLAAHKLRTALSVSGLMVGVAAVMVMVAFARGAEADVLARFQAMGTDLVVVSAAPAPRIAGRPRQAPNVTLLRPGDARVLEQGSLHARGAAPSVSRSVLARWEDRPVPTTLNGITPTGLRLRNVMVARGRAFDDLDEVARARVALLGPTAARALFGGRDPVGQEIRVGGTVLEVIGVTHPRGTDLGGADQDDVVLVPLETALRRVLNVPYVNTIFVQATGSADLPELEADVRGILDALHPARTGATELFRVQNQAQLLRSEQEAARSLSTLVVGVAGLGFAVGGVGVLAVMLLSVRERVREVGLRRALGARRRDVRLQFLIEATLLAVLGGAAGTVLGVAAASTGALLGPWELRVSWRAALLAPFASTAVGVVSGLIPALKASRVEPVEALTGRLES
jgi:putative ABC transport system permease protein